MNYSYKFNDDTDIETFYHSCKARVEYRVIRSGLADIINDTVNYYRLLIFRIYDFGRSISGRGISIWIMTGCMDNIHWIYRSGNDRNK